MKKLRNFLPSQRFRVPLSIYRKKIVLTRRAFWDLENFSTFSKNFFLDFRRRSADRVSQVTTKSSIDRFRRFYNSSTLSRTHKSLLARATPSIRYRSPVMRSFNSPVLCQTWSGRVEPSEPVKKLRTFFAISEVPCPSLYIVNDVSSRADGKYLEKFSTFFRKISDRRCPAAL